MVIVGLQWATGVILPCAGAGWSNAGTHASPFARSSMDCCQVG